MSGSIAVEPFGVTERGEAVRVYTLRNAGGVEMRVASYGGRVVSLRVPDRRGRPGDVVLGYDSLEGYLSDPAYFGALVGRYANRIARGRFTLDGRVHELSVNEGPHHLHGGSRGFDRVVWDVEPFEDRGVVGLVLTHTSPDGEQGYPGTLRVRLVCTLTDEDAVAFDYHATTDRATPLNLTHHGYFNLAADSARDVLDHVLTLNASRFVPVDAALIPMGTLHDVAGTPFDFRRPTPIGARIDSDDVQLRFGGGYDHCFVLDGGEPAGAPAFAARLHDPASGRVVQVHTTEPGLQFYSGNGLDTVQAGKGGAPYGRRAGVALETQRFPDSPNQPRFPSAILRPGEAYRSRTVYAFTLQH